ncbi:terpene synthase [Micromonospora mangrovi]|uniref:Terpene synthase n=2 Tax=Micromonospora TaxID=1873 RepID=A0AAU8HEI2_9ACTN
MRSFAVSALHEPPFPARRHPETDRVAGESLAWARALGLVAGAERERRLRRAAAAELAGRTCPDGPVERLRLLTDLIGWLFVMDDACDDDGLGATPVRLAPTVAALLAVLDGYGGPGTPPATRGLAAGLDDICRRARACGCPALLLRLVSQLREYLLALLWEAGYREHHRVPAVAEYVQLRRHTGAARPAFTLTDLAYGPAARPGRHAEPAVAALDVLAADLVCWCNDIFSFGKEHRTGADPLNLVTSIARESGAGEAVALRTAAARFNTALAAYVEGDAALVGDPDAAGFLAARRNWIRGTYDWSLRAARYA